MLLIIFFIGFIFPIINIVGEFDQSHELINDTLHIITLPNFIVNENEDDRRFQYGHKFEVDYGIKNSGTWTTLDNGDMIWRLGVKSKGAYAMKLQFDQFYIPQGANIVIYNELKDIVYGPYTSNNNSSRTFGAPLIGGEMLIVEYYQPSGYNEEVELNISAVIHDYTDIFHFQENRDRNCGYNVICDDAQEFRDQSNSVIYMIINQYTCSGTLINNVNNDNTPYVLTAWHCVVGETNLNEHNDFTYYFNHESPTCEGNSGSFEYSVSGSTLLATRNENVGSDFALLVMDQSPPEEWNPFYAGWSNDESAPLISVGIHHPEDDPRKINYDDDYAYSCAWTTNDTHWCLSWDDGGTASGSSGSPLFNFDKQIIGTNTGSDGPDCSAGPDLYGKFSLSWDGGNNATRRLQEWLDPDDTGVVAIDGVYTNSTIPGDLNSDQVINILDVILLVNIILDLDPFNSSGDINLDGQIDILDVVQLVNIILT